MDNNKDNNIQQNKSVSVNMSNKNIDPISFFEKDEAFVFVYKKTEKLTTALYMITNLFSDSEPMKWALRKKVSDLLSFTLTYKDVMLSQYTNFTRDMKTRILEIVSLLEVSSRSGLVSPMNFSILKQEFSQLTSVLDSAQTAHMEPSHPTLQESFFDVSRGYPQGTVAHTNNSNDGWSESSQGGMGDIKDNKELKDTSEVKRTNRQTIILNMLKKKADLTIKDIAGVIRDCSEKTIQRELITLISQGTIKKTGERRWSKYSLVNES